MHFSTLEFADSLRKGTGRAVRMMQAAPYDTDFKAAVLHACLNDLRYDAQCEESRARYLYGLIQMTGCAPEFRLALEASLQEAAGADSYWDLLQAFNILCLMSTQDAAAQALLRRFVLTSDNRDLAISQAYELIRLQGIWVFLECIHHFTSELADESWIFRGFMRELEERDGKEATESALQAARQRSAPLDFLMRTALEDEKEETQPEVAQDYSVLKARLNQETAFHFPSSWVEAASKADLEQAVADLLSETDDRRVIQYLMIFRRHSYPRDPNLLLPFLESANCRLARRAADVIRLVRHGLITDVVGDMMRDGRFAIAALLLEGSRSLDDLLMMRRLLEQSLRDEEEYHSVGFSARRQIREVTGQEDTIREMLLHMYEHQPCSQCREHAVELLSERGGLPAWLV